MASTDKDYASLRGMDFKKARDILTKDGFHEHEYGDKDDNNGYAVYRKGDKEVELTYEWVEGKRKGEAHAGKVTNVYVDDNINSSCGKKSVKASNEGRSDLIYVIMVNGDPIAKGSYDAMVKKSYTYNYPVQMLKFPKAKLNSLMKMAKDAHRPDPLKFAVNRFINDYTDEYDSLNASCTKKSVNAAKNIKKKSRNVQVYFWHNNAYNAVVMTDGEYWITFDDSFDGIDLYDEDVITELKSYIKTTDFNDFDDMYNQFANDENGNSPVVGDNFGGEFDTSELTKVGTIYEDKANSSCTKKSVKASRKPIKAATDISNPYIRIFLTNLGKYNEGELVGEWVDLPVTDFDGVLERIGINDQYEEYFITDYETNIPNLSIGEYDSLDELNNMASQIDSLDESQILIMSARLYNGESFEDALAGCDDGSIYYDCYSDQDLGYEIIDQIGGTEQLDKDTLEMYFDYDGYGRDIRLNGSFIEIEPGTLVELY
jgi:antirestriction protein